MNTKTFVLTLLLATAASAETATLPKRIDQLVQPYVQYNAFSGVVFAAKGNEVLFEKAYGMANYEFSVPNTVDTRFAIASITKRFTSVILQHLFAEQKLSPDDVLAKWVPDFPSADAITIRHLMTHRSGLRDPDKLRRIIRQNFTTADVVEALKSEKIVTKPGEVYSYTTANYAILGHIIERVTGKTYAEVVKQYVYGPAKMTDSGELTTTTVVPHLATGYMPDPFGHGISVCGPEDTSWKVGGGSSYSTARDLHRFVRALYDGTLVTREVAFASWIPPAKTFDKRVTSLSGAFPGAGANVLYFVDDDVAVIVLSNNYATVASGITQSVAAMIFDQPVTPLAVPALSATQTADPKIAGHYEVEGRGWTFQVIFREGRPIAAWNSIRQSAMLRVSDDTWFEPLDWATLQLKFDTNGNYVEGWFHYPGMDAAKVLRR